VNNNLFRVFPNPARSLVNISGVKDIREVSVMDDMGRMVLRFTEGDLSRISLATLPDGIYFVRVVSGEGVNAAKITLSGK